MSDHKEKVRSWTERLVHDLASFKEKNIRTSIFAESLNRLKAGNMVLVIDDICRRAEEKTPGYQELLFSLIDIPAITAILGYQKMSDVYLLSRQMGYERVTRLLSSPPPKKRRYSEYDFVEGQGLDHITSGEKRSLAKGIKKDTLDRLVYDPDPHVINNLLNNPRITERDVLKIASKRPTAGEVLLEVFNNKKWIERYSIKRALVKNPYTPTRVSLGLVNFMLAQDLKEISKDGTIHEVIRKAADDLLKRDRA